MVMQKDSSGGRLKILLKREETVGKDQLADMCRRP
jgi:hypothetical protein